MCYRSINTFIHGRSSIIPEWQQRIYTVRWRYNSTIFLQNTHNKHPMASYGVYFVDTNTNLFCLNHWAILCHIGSRYNGLWLYGKLLLDSNTQCDKAYKDIQEAFNSTYIYIYKYRVKRLLNIFISFSHCVYFVYRCHWFSQWHNFVFS